MGAIHAPEARYRHVPANLRDIGNGQVSLQNQIVSSCHSKPGIERRRRLPQMSNEKALNLTSRQLNSSSEHLQVNGILDAGLHDLDYF